MNNDTKINIVKKYLEDGNYIDDMKAVELCQSYRLSAIIYELRHRYDMNIQDRWITNSNTGNRYKQYYVLRSK